MLSVNSALITCSTALSFRQRAKSKGNKNEFFTDIHSTSKRNMYDLRRVFPESSSQFQLTIYPLYVDSDRCCVERACVYVKRFCSRYRGHFCILKKRKNGTSDRFVPIRWSKSCEKKIDDRASEWRWRKFIVEKETANAIFIISFIATFIRKTFYLSIFAQRIIRDKRKIIFTRSPMAICIIE